MAFAMATSPLRPARTLAAAPSPRRVLRVRCPAGLSALRARGPRGVLGRGLVAFAASNPDDKAGGDEAEAKRIREEAEAATRKWGLEAGLWKSLRGGGSEGKATAKDLLKRYGSAYLITSISLSLVSFTICYLLISNGVDVPALLAKLNIETSSTGETVGTVAIAYAAHKAASPIRFPPTVAITPMVANWLGKKDDGDEAL